MHGRSIWAGHVVHNKKCMWPSMSLAPCMHLAGLKNPWLYSTNKGQIWCYMEAPPHLASNIWSGLQFGWLMQWGPYAMWSGTWLLAPFMPPSWVGISAQLEPQSPNCIIPSNATSHGSRLVDVGATWFQSHTFPAYVSGISIPTVGVWHTKNTQSG